MTKVPNGRQAAMSIIKTTHWFKWEGEKALTLNEMRKSLPPTPPPIIMNERASEQASEWNVEQTSIHATRSIVQPNTGFKNDGRIVIHFANYHAHASHTHKMIFSFIFCFCSVLAIEYGLRRERGREKMWTRIYQAPTWLLFRLIWQLWFGFVRWMTGCLLA